MQISKAKWPGKFIVCFMATLMVMQTFWAAPFDAHAGSGEWITIHTGAPSLHVELKYGDKTETGKTDQSGNYKAGGLYDYLAGLGWDGSAEIEQTSVTVNYKINYPDASGPDERENEGGDPSYLGKKDSATIRYDAESPNKWKEAITFEAPEKEDVLSGQVKIIEAGKTIASAVPASGIPVEIGSKEVFTDENGEFTFFGYSKEKNPDSVLSIDATEKYTAEKATLSEFSGTFYIYERPSAATSDYEIVGAENGYVAKPSTDTEYTIKAKGSNKLTLTRDGEGKDEITVTLDSSSLETTTFYVIKGGVCSDAVKNAIKVDQTSPELTSIETKAVDGVKIKSHGIYTKKKAELLLTVTVSDSESGVGSIKLIGKEDSGKTEYDTSKVVDKGGVKEATFIIESQKELMKQTLYLVCFDKVGNRTKEILLRGSEEASEITLEIIPPIVGESKVVKGSINDNGWYKEAISLEGTISDAESGLADVVVTTNNGKKLFEREYSDKVLTEQTIKFDLPESIITSEANSTGEYTILTKATDNSGNITANSIKVKIDLVTPKLSISGAEEGAYLNKSPSITIKEDENYPKAEGNRFTAVVKRNGKEVYTKTFKQTDEGSIPESTFATDGKYYIEVTGEDAAGNKAEAVNRSFIKDATAPVVSLKGPAGGKYYNKAQKVTVSVNETNYSSNNVTIKCTRTLKGKTVNVNFPWHNSGVISSSSITVKETGEYKFTVYAVDKAGNRSATKTLSFTVDTVAPTLNISGVAEGKTYTYDDLIAPAITFSDDYLAGRTVNLTRAGFDWYSKLAKSEGSGSIRFSNFEKVKGNDGLYSLTVTVNDKAGNSTTKKIAFTVNRFGSSFKYNDAIKALNGQSVQNVTEKFVISEFNVSKLDKTKNEIRLDGSVLDDANTKTKANGTENGVNRYRHEFSTNNFQKEGVYELNVISKDKAGNTMESKKENGKVKFIVDRTKPTLKVSGYEKVNKADSINLTVITSDSLSEPVIFATSDGMELRAIKGPEGYTVTLSEGAGQHVKITATDAAGNTEEFTETISVVPNGLLYALLKYKFPIGGGILAAAAAAIFLLLKKKRKNEENPAA